MESLQSAPAPKSAAGRGKRLLCRALRGLGGLGITAAIFAAVLLVCLRFDFPFCLGLVFGLPGVVAGKTLVSRRRVVRGTRARVLGLVWVAQGCASSVFSYLEKHDPLTFQAHLVAPTIAVIWVGFPLLWGVSALLSEPRAALPEPEAPRGLPAVPPPASDVPIHL